MRDYKFFCENAPGIQAHSVLPDPLLHPDPDPVPDELIINWSLVAGNFPTEYDVEWAWIDKDAEANFKEAGNWVPDLIFRNNATRITVPAVRSADTIPLLYDESEYKRWTKVREAAGIPQQ